MSKTAFHTDSMKTRYEFVVIHRLAVHILSSMRTKILMVVAVMLVMVSAAYDCQIIESGIGDSNLLTLGGFTCTKPISIDLMPSNVPNYDVPNYDVRYSIRCQVIYKDKTLPRPETDKENELALETRKYLNSCLRDLVEELYVGMEFADLLAKYYDGRFAKDLNDRFAEYVAKINPRVNIDIVTVTVNADGEFRAMLVELRKQLNSQHN